MATGANMLGTHPLDVLAIQTSEVATFGTTGSNVLFTTYDRNTPTVNQYSVGMVNTTGISGAPVFSCVRMDDVAAPNAFRIGETSAYDVGGVALDGSVLADNVLTSSAFARPDSRRYPPAGLSAAVSTISGQTYGNGEYSVTTSYDAFSSNVRVDKAFDNNHETYFLPAPTPVTGARPFSVNMTTGLPLYASNIPINVDGSNITIYGLDINVTLPVGIVPTRFELLTFPNTRRIREHAMYASTDGNVWTRIFYENTTTALDGGIYVSYFIPPSTQPVAPRRYYRYFVTRVQTPSTSTLMGFYNILLYGYEPSTSRLPEIHTSRCLHVHGMNAAIQSTVDIVASGTIRKYPPIGLTNAVVLLTNQTYGNGTYLVWSTTPPELNYMSIQNAFNGTLDHASTTNWFSPSIFSTDSVTFVITSAPQTINVDGAPRQITGLDVNIQMPVHITPTHFVLFATEHIAEHYLFSSVNGKVWKQIFYENLSVAFNNDQPYTYAIPSSSARTPANYYKYVAYRLYNPSGARMRIREFTIYGYEQTSQYTISSSGIQIGSNTAVGARNVICVDNGDVRITSSTTETQLRTYPPINNFTADTHTITGQAYGNGTYILKTITPRATVGEQIFNAFDGNNLTNYIPDRQFLNNSTYNAPNVYPYVQRLFVDGVQREFLAPDFQIQLPISIVCTGFNITTGSHMPKRHYLLGSDNGIVWSEIYSQSNILLRIPTFTFNNTKSFSYYKYLVTECVGGLTATVFRIEEFSLIGYDDETISIISTANGRVSVGNVPDPSSNLNVAGDMYVSGKLLASNIEIPESNSLSIQSLSPVRTTVVTNDVNAANRVLYSFRVHQGYYMLRGCIRYTLNTSMLLLETVNWLTLELYKLPNLNTPTYTVNMNTSVSSQEVNTVFSVDDVNGSDFVLSVNGAGHTLSLSSDSAINIAPISGFGINDTATLPVQVPPVRSRFVTSTNQQVFTVYSSNIVTLQSSSNIDVYINGSRSSNAFINNLTQSVINNGSQFTITLAEPQPQNRNVEIILWATPTQQNYMPTGYVYQKVFNLAAPIGNVTTDNARISGDLVIDGSLFARSNVFRTFNTSTFSPVILSSNTVRYISEDIVTTQHFQDSAVTTSNIADASVISSHIADGTLTYPQFGVALPDTKFQEFSVQPQHLNLTNDTHAVGFSSLPRGQWHVSNVIMTNNGFQLNTSNNVSMDTFNHIGMDIQTSNMAFLQIRPVVLCDATELTSIASGQQVSSWGGGALQQDNVLTPNNPIYTLSTPSYVSFTNAYLTSGNNVYPIITNRGVTIIAHVQFLVNASDSVFLELYNTLYTTMFRISTVSATRSFRVTITTPPSQSFTVDVPNAYIENEWSTFVFTIDDLTNVSVYRNGELLIHSVSGYPEPQFAVSYSPLNCKLYVGVDRNGTINSSQFLLHALHIYDDLPSQNDIVRITSILWHQGRAVYSRFLPLGYMYTSSAITSHSISRETMLWMVDSTSDVQFSNITIDTTVGRYICSVASGTYLDVGPYYYRFNHPGVTITVQFSFSQVSNNECIFHISNVGDVATTEDFIQLERSGTTNSIVCTIYFNNKSCQLTSVSQLQLNSVYTVSIVLYVYQSELWINGVRDVITLTSTDNLHMRYTMMQHAIFGQFNGSLYMASCHNRAFTNAEVEATHAVLARDNQLPSVAGIQIGSSTSRNLFAQTTFLKNMHVSSNLYIGDQNLNIRSPLLVDNDAILHDGVIAGSEYNIYDTSDVQRTTVLIGDAVINADSPFPNVSSEGCISLPGTVGSCLRHFYTPSLVSITSGFTCECFVKYTTFTNASLNGRPSLCGIMLTGSTNLYGWSFGANSNSVVTFSTDTVNYPGTTGLQSNVWNHIAFCLEPASTNIYNLHMYRNGTRDQYVSSVSLTLDTNRIQFVVGQYNDIAVNAKISNLRCVRSALYTTPTITVPTTPLSITNAANTMILLRVLKTNATPMVTYTGTQTTIANSLNTFSLATFRNKIINGHMSIDQRYNGAAVNTITGTLNGSFYVIDRWCMNVTMTSGGFTVQRQTLTSTDAPFLSGIPYSLRITVANALLSTSKVMPTQVIEAGAINELGWLGNGSGYAATLSFWFKANASGTYQASIQTTTHTWLGTFVVDANTWKYVSFTISPPPKAVSWIDTNVQIIIGHLNNSSVTSETGWVSLTPATLNSSASALSWITTANNYIEFTGVQLERGNVATSMEHRPLHIELDLCKRYYETSGTHISIYPESETCASDLVNINVGDTVNFTTSKRLSSTYTVNVYDIPGTLNRISAKFASGTTTNNIQVVILDRTNTSFYIAISNNATGYQTVVGSAYTTFTRGNLIFRWEIDAEIIP